MSEGASRYCHRSADIPVRSKACPANRAQIQTQIAIGHCCGLECPRSGSVAALPRGGSGGCFRHQMSPNFALTRDLGPVQVLVRQRKATKLCKQNGQMFLTSSTGSRTAVFSVRYPVNRQPTLTLPVTYGNPR